MKYVCPLIVVKDINRSRKFYEDVMGQTVKMDFGENVTFQGDFSIHLSTHYKDLLGGTGTEVVFRANNGELYFESEDIQADSEKISAAGMDIVHPLREQPWRQLVFRFYDPDGHILELGETMPALIGRLKKEGLDAAGIAGTTSLPLEFVESLF